jgi:hypothetical protein
MSGWAAVVQGPFGHCPWIHKNLGARRFQNLGSEKPDALPIRCQSEGPAYLSEHGEVRRRRKKRLDFADGAIRQGE